MQQIAVSEANVKPKPRFNATELRRTEDGHLEVVGPVWVDVDEEPDHRSAEARRRSLQRLYAKYGPEPQQPAVKAPRVVAGRCARAPRRQRRPAGQARAGDADGEPAPSRLERRLQRAKQTRDRERAALNLWRRYLREQSEDTRKDLEVAYLLKHPEKFWRRTLPAVEAASFASHAARPLASLVCLCRSMAPWSGGYRALVGSASGIAALLLLSRRSVFRALAELEAGGWIVRLPRYRPGKGDRRHLRTSNAYAPGPALLAAWEAATEVQCHRGTASQRVKHNARKSSYDREVGATRDQTGPEGSVFSGAAHPAAPAGPANTAAEYAARLRANAAGLSDDVVVRLVARAAARGKVAP